MRYFSILVLSVFGLGSAVTVGAEMVRGAAVVLEGSGGFEIIVPGEDVTIETFDEPRYFPGVFSCQAAPGGSVLIQMSNGMLLYFRGEGFFSVERFEASFSLDQQSKVAAQEARSHMILNMRRGRLIVDSGQLSEASRLVMETPFGRVAAVNAVFMVDIDFDRRSGIYDFTIASAEGAVRLSDLRQQSYTVYPGQRIAGAGSYETPSIEIGRQTDQVRQLFDGFFSIREGLDEGRIDPLQMQAHFQALPDVSSMLPALSLSAGSTDKRPRVIEFAPPTQFITPFRGELRKPSASEADLF